MSQTIEYKFSILASTLVLPIENHRNVEAGKREVMSKN